MTSTRLAIDFGTTNSVLARWNEERQAGETVPLTGLSNSPEAGAHLIPTLLYVQEGRSGDVLIGQAVRAGGFDRKPGNRLFRNFKRGIGSDNSEARILDGAPWSDFDAGQHFLRRMLAALPYPPSEIEQLVITVPVAAFEGYTNWLSRALGEFGERVRIVDESTAAALGYAVTEPGAMVLVIDFGGGTLDLSLVRLPDSREKTGKVLFTNAGSTGGGTARVIAKSGVPLGGSDIDRWLLEYTLAESGVSLEQLGEEHAPLLSACEAAKVHLTGQEKATVSFQAGGQEYQIPITRAEFEALMERNGFYASLSGALEKVMGLAHQKGVYREDIHHVLLVGGTSLIPSVQKTLDTFFRAVTDPSRRRLTDMPEWPATTWKVEGASIRADKPFTAVVEGALLVSAGFGVDDQLTHGYGLRYRAADGSLAFDEILPMGSSTPTPQPVRVTLAASQPNQREMAFVIGQISAEAVAGAALHYENGQPVFAAGGSDGPSIRALNEAHPLTLPLDPPGQPGKPRLEAAFRVDDNRRLRLTVTDLQTRKKLADEVALLSLGTSAETAEKETATGPAAAALAPALSRPPKGGFRLSLAGLGSILTNLNPQQASPDVLGMAMRSEDSLARFNAADLLARRGDREARLIFEEILGGGLPHQRASAARHLFRFSWFAAEPLFRRALADEDPRVAESAVFALCKMRQPEAYRLVMDVLQTGSDALRMSAVWGLQSHPDAGAVPVLALALKAANHEIRALALEVLGATDAPAAIPLVRAALDHPDLETKYAATLSWIELARQECFTELAGILDTVSGQERRWILRGLFHATNYLGLELGSDAGSLALLEALGRAATDPLPAARLAAALPLTWCRQPRAGELLRSIFINDPDSITRAHILTNAVHLMSPLGPELITLALNGDDVLVKQTAEFLSQSKDH